ncbi:MAG: hypothetical protein WC254_04500 [Candidatus Woesearchaeota archaeon]|jgi:hypothetical protein
MNDLKMHHIIVLVSLFVSIIGTLLLLEKINATAEPIPTATVISVPFPETYNEVKSEEQVEIHITNTTED